MSEKTIHLRLERIYLKEQYTIGKLYIGEDYLCDVIEDRVRDLNKDGNLEGPGEGKVPKETAIPYGRYEVIVNMSPKFKRELPLLLNVKHFEGIRIHRGNTAADTDGCIIPGENKEKGKVVNSTPYEIMLTGYLTTMIKLGYTIFITII